MRARTASRSSARRARRSETVWTYSDSRAAAKALSRKDLAETFGFDPTVWGQSG